MVNSGEEFLMVDSYNIPWLIWIQMFVFFLFLLLLLVFGIVSSDTSDNGCLSADSVPSTSCSSLSRRFLSGDQIPISHHGLGFSVNSSLIQSNQVGSSQAIKGEITPAATMRVTRREGEECPLEKDSTSNLHHPCNLFQLAGTAFLKCFGIDRSTEENDDSLRPESKKQM
uniref:Transmembrane protein n=1 Tax=Noccaea caerulescens TaxID=107243 RepID=A0A1J3DB89_NOCCA